MTLRNKFTLIITVHERKRDTHSLLEYYSDLPCNIIVADSSIEAFNIKEDYSHVNVVHTPNKLYYKKMYDILKEVKTPFALELPDDDIVFKDAIHTCVNFLHNNTDYSFVDGVWRKEPNWKKQTSYFLESDFYSKDPLERIRVCLNEHWKAPNHSIVKTDVLKRNYEFVVANELWPIRWFDKIWMFLACFDGNYKMLNIDYGRRNPKASLMKTLGNNYPKELKKHLNWKRVLLGDNLRPLINFCIDRGYDPNFSEKFVRDIAKNVK